MALNSKLTTLAANAQVNALAALLDGGFLEIYDGVQPVRADAAIMRQVKLATCTFSSPAFKPAVDGVAEAYEITPEPNANASGHATWYRLLRADGTPVLDGSVGEKDANLILTKTAISIRAEVSVESYSLTVKR